MSLNIEVVLGDITKADTDAIVNAANNKFWMGSGVAGAIKEAGGAIIEDEAMKNGIVMPGEAIATTAGKLPYHYVIHAAVMGQDLRTTDKYIRQATVSSLNLAEKLKLTSLAFPAFGTGVGGFPMPACARLMMNTVFGYNEMANNLQRIQFRVFDRMGEVLFNEALQRALTKRF